MSQWAAIVDPDTGQEVPDECVGEIWLHGDNIGRGYWARPEETEYTFGNKLQSRLDSGSHAEGASDDAMWLRTGDLGVYIDSELYITGRIKDMVILDGRNHYPQDIEATVAEASNAIRAGFVAAFCGSGARAARRQRGRHQREAGDRRRTRAGRRPGGPAARHRRRPQSGVSPHGVHRATTSGWSPRASSRARRAANWPDAHAGRSTSTGRSAPDRGVSRRTTRPPRQA